MFAHFTFHIQHWVLLSAYSSSISRSSQVEAISKTAKPAIHTTCFLWLHKRSGTSIFSFCNAERTNMTAATPLKEAASQGTADTHADARRKVEDTIIYCVLRCCQTLTLLQNIPCYKISNHRYNTAHPFAHSVLKSNKLSETESEKKKCENWSHVQSIIQFYARKSWM